MVIKKQKEQKVVKKVQIFMGNTGKSVTIDVHDDELKRFRDSLRQETRFMVVNDIYGDMHAFNINEIFTITTPGSNDLADELNTALMLPLFDKEIITISEFRKMLGFNGEIKKAKAGLAEK